MTIARGPVYGVVLAAVAGSVDVLEFTRLGHVFASIVTGNIVVAGVSVAGGDGRQLVCCLVSVAAYALGVAAGVVVTGRGRPGSSPWPVRSTVTCALELALLLAAAGVWWGSDADPSGAAEIVAILLLSSAMGLQTAAFRTSGVPGVTTTYFTGTLTSVMTGLAAGKGLNRPALAALVALAAGAVVTGVVLAHAEDWAVLVPLVLLAGLLVHAVSERVVSAG